MHCTGSSKGHCWPSQKTIAARTGIGATSVEDHLKVLISFLLSIEVFTYFCYNQFDKLEFDERRKLYEW